jgi:plasmid replication initiation protein
MSNTKTITIQKDSQLISIYASGALTATQKKVYNCLIYMSKQMLKEDSNRHRFEVQVQDIISCISDKNVNIKELKDSIIELQNIKVEFNTLEKNKTVIWSRFPLIAGVEIKDGVLKYNFAFQVLEYIQQPQTYAYLDLRIMKNLDTKHSISLYEILKDYKNLQLIEIEFTKFKKAMDIKENQYNRFNNFRDYVLDPAIKEINEKTDLEVSYEKITKGRKVTDLQFKIKTKIDNMIEDRTITNRKQFIDWIRNDKVNEILYKIFDTVTEQNMEIACSAKGLLYDKLSLITYTSKQGDMLWSKLYERYKDGKLEFQK